jgi:transglutaminase-like putative cysteine protease
LKENSFELHVQAIRKPQTVETPGEAGEEFLKSCTFINSEDAKVRELAERAVGKETDAWKKAQLVERWVHDNMRLNNATPITTASQTARDLEGDCRHHALLAAALCRAAGVPSRTAVGLIYVNHRQRGPVMAFHMWTEVWVRGQWLAIDGTLGQGSVGADHVKIADHSWCDVQSLTPLLPVTRVLGKIAMEVVRVNGMD